MKRIFILGCERSCTTWLANIFDVHANVELIMEPFADFLFIFPGIPKRNTYIAQPSVEQVRSVEKGYKRLLRLKYPFLYKSGRPLYLKKWDRYFFTQCKRVLRKFHKDFTLKLLRYYLLHLHTLNIPIEQQTRKKHHPAFEVTKELRTNFKVSLLSQVFPDSLYLVVIRHPGAQVSSIRRLFQKGSLGELNKSIQTFFEDIGQDPRFEKYRPLLRHFKGAGPGKQTAPERQDDNVNLILWWLINYEVLLEDLKARSCKFQLVSHEEISENPQVIVKEIFNFIGLEVSEVVRTYLEMSTHTQRQEIQSNVDTNRESANYYKQMIDRVDPDLNQILQEVIAYHSAQMDPLLRQYLQRSYSL